MIKVLIIVYLAIGVLACTDFALKESDDSIIEFMVENGPKYYPELYGDDAFEQYLRDNFIAIAVSLAIAFVVFWLPCVVWHQYSKK